ncbi:GNAT family N-acetyltransferase [Radiobacillus sp. PE A8.2]|uniref:GNAT family N-acetyltransferase n=1 Tax=Radiobacillus sp. PE A8.2 TaxID=3380349 RepID=UPI003890C4CF
MILVEKATPDHVAGIAHVCIEGCRATYKGLRSTESIERNNKLFYNEKRILTEVTEVTDSWDGWFVALEAGEVIGAIGGGMTGVDVSEVFVLYLNPNRRNEGIGTMLLEKLTEVQREKGSMKQWVSVQKANQKGIPFYEAKGFHLQAEQPAYANAPGENYVSLRYCRSI